MMYPSFSGNSRRPRQVNLSGQNVNSFAASGWTPTASGTQKTIAAAQAGRQQRQQERLRLISAKRIQRAWRGCKTRRELAESRRETWDAMENDILLNDSGSKNLVEKLRLLLSFFNCQNLEDINRLSRFSERLLRAAKDRYMEEELRPRLLKLSQVILEALASSTENANENMLRLLTEITGPDLEIKVKLAWKYYETISSLVINTPIARNSRSLLLDSIRSPLRDLPHSEDSQHLQTNIYNAFALNFLATTNLSEILGSLEEISRFVNMKLLSQALISASSSASLLNISSGSRLWLLSQFIALHRFQEGTDQEPIYLKALSVILSGSANEIVGRIDAVEQESHSEDDDENPVQPLPKFVKDQLKTLVNKQSITGLLAKFEIVYFANHATAAEGDVSLLASYALILLRIFPRLGEEIRMWLYQGSISVSGSTTQLPALKLFWQAMNTTGTFYTICTDSKAALSILLPQTRQQISAGTSKEDVMRDRDWRAILLFLELYAFVLRFTDDEEFLSGGAPELAEPQRILSRSRESALLLQEVKLLTVFLKNLSFTMYFNAAELADDDGVSNEGGLGSHFGNSSLSKGFGAASPSGIAESSTKRTGDDRPFLGISGMTFNYVRSIVTRVMRMLYERDSRRRFLPNDHWLMTSRFDMEGFIPAVVMEEERRHQVAEVGDETNNDDGWPLPTLSDRHNIVGMRRRGLHLETLRRREIKALRYRMLATIGPRLEILQNMPFVIPFATRVQIFRQFVYQDQLRRRSGHVDPDHWRMSVSHMGVTGNIPSNGRDILNRHHAKISRNQIFEDAFEQFYRLGDGLKEPIQITFVDKFGATEAGIDGGGVTKEFLTSITKEAFRCEGGLDLFITNDQNLLYPNPSALDEKKELLRVSGTEESSSEWRESILGLLRRYEFLGRIIGKCLYEGILVDISFAGFFLLKWSSTDTAGSPSQDSRYIANINDLRDLDESLYQGLLQLKNYPGDVSDFSLDFTINDTASMPGEPIRTITRNLLPNGSNISVTNENRVLYISGVARHRLHIQPFQQTRAFLRGLGEIINPSWLSMFNQTELQTLIGGDSSEIDVDDLRRNTIYSGVYEIGDDGIEHPTIQIFWQVMKSLDDSDRRKVLKYVTSTPRAPLLGFTQLNPRFSIRDAGTDEQRLPSTSTCMNLLKLPRYQTATALQHKLLYAVNSGAGFDLS